MKTHSVPSSPEKEKEILNRGLDVLIFPLTWKPRPWACLRARSSERARLSKRLLCNEAKRTASRPSSRGSPGGRSGQRPPHRPVTSCRRPHGNPQPSNSSQPGPRAAACGARLHAHGHAGKRGSPRVWLAPRPTFLSLGGLVAHVHPGRVDGGAPLPGLSQPAAALREVCGPPPPVSEHSHTEARSPPTPAPHHPLRLSTNAPEKPLPYRRRSPVFSTPLPETFRGVLFFLLGLSIPCWSVTSYGYRLMKGDDRCYHWVSQENRFPGPR